MAFITKKAKVGDIVMSKEFANREIASANNTGRDDTRGKAEWLVVKTEFTGGGVGMSPYDIYPDGHKVTVRRLAKGDRSFEGGEILSFYQSGCFCNMIKELKVVGKMMQTWADSGLFGKDVTVNNVRMIDETSK